MFSVKVKNTFDSWINCLQDSPLVCSNYFQIEPFSMCGNNHFEKL